MAQKVKRVKTNEGHEMLLQNEDLALLLPGLHCGNFLKQFYDTETGANLPEVVPEDAFKFNVATMVPKN